MGKQVAVTASVLNPGSGGTIHWYKNGSLFNTTAGANLSYPKTAGTDTLLAFIIGREIPVTDRMPVMQ